VLTPGTSGVLKVMKHLETFLVLPPGDPGFGGDYGFGPASFAAWSSVSTFAPLSMNLYGTP
jgi:hypothetical protein